MCLPDSDGQPCDEVQRKRGVKKASSTLTLSQLQIKTHVFARSMFFNVKIVFFCVFAWNLCYLVSKKVVGTLGWGCKRSSSLKMEEFKKCTSSGKKNERAMVSMGDSVQKG